MIQRDKVDGEGVFICSDGSRYGAELDALAHESKAISGEFSTGVWFTIKALEQLEVDLPFPFNTGCGQKPTYIAHQIRKNRSVKAAIGSLMP